MENVDQQATFRGGNWDQSSCSAARLGQQPRQIERHKTTRRLIIHVSEWQVLALSANENETRLGGKADPPAVRGRI